MGLRENSTEHNLSHYQVGPQSGPNAGLVGLSEAYKEPDNTFSMPDDGIRTSSPITHSLYPTQTSTSSPITHSLYPLTRFVHQVLIRHRNPVVEHVYVYVHMRDYRCLFIRPPTCIWPGILFISISHASSPRAMLFRRAQSPGARPSRAALAARQRQKGQRQKGQLWSGLRHRDMRPPSLRHADLRNTGMRQTGLL